MSKTVEARERHRLRRKRKRMILRHENQGHANGPTMGMAQILAYFNQKRHMPGNATPEVMTG